ncbi:phenylalanine--tRNA ligase subunit beta [Candidatus Peregrinibacteria bacterium]|nr:phenylalanine--tRNA ligase subunit beta [Candidatus Peregrinibacteria bacterium]
MKISLNWIKEFVDIPKTYGARQLAELLTLRTCEVEAYEDEALKFSNMIVGKAIRIRPHPNADKLRLVDTDAGGRTIQIVCGGQNLAEGMLVAVALPGALVRWHGEGDLIELKETKIRGETSVGMICAEEEIGLPSLTPPEGITIMNVSCHLESDAAARKAPGTPLAEALGLGDIIFEIDNKSLTHRPDLWGHYGMAREFSAFLGKKLKDFAVKNPAVKKGPRVEVAFEKSDIAKRFCSSIITGITIRESPPWMQKRLRAVGVRPVNNIVDITNYVMLELGHPLHAFDRQAVGGDRLEIRFAEHGERFVTLDHKTRELDPADALVTNGKEVLALAGVMGGLRSEVTPQTSEIILEVACWNPVMIRKTAQRHALRSDAAQRFEKSLDPEVTGIAFHRARQLIREICSGAKEAGPVTDWYPEQPKTVRLSVDPARVQKKAGSKIPEQEMMVHLKALQFEVKKNGKKLAVTVPTFRATKDIAIEDDLVEEIVRMHGYEKIAPVLPVLPARPPRENRERALKNRIRQLFSLGMGFTESLQYSFYGVSEIQKALLPREPHITIQNPLTNDQTHLRISLIPNMLKAAANNLHADEKVKIYEIGRTYIKEPRQYFPREEKFIAGMAISRKIK